jgi:hypothetical protein
MSALSRGPWTSVYLASCARAVARPPSASAARAFAVCNALCRSRHSPRHAALARRGSAQALSGQAGACAGPTAAPPAAAQPAAPAGRRRRARGRAPARTQTARRRWRVGSRAAAARGTAGRASPRTAAARTMGRQASVQAGGRLCSVCSRLSEEKGDSGCGDTRQGLVLARRGAGAAAVCAA